MINILIVDDHPLVRESLANLLHQQPDLRVSAEAENVHEALDRLNGSPIDLAIVDLALKGLSGFELIRSIKEKYPATKVLVISMHDERHYAERAIRAGARGYLMKSESTRKIVHAIRQVLSGKLALSTTLADAVTQRYVEGDAPFRSAMESLSNREMEVFLLIGRGFDTRSIAAELNVSIKTVQAFCARIKEKLKLASAMDLVREAIRWTANEAGEPRSN